ncbi:amidohydrolase [Bacteroidota bacterium]
MEYLVNIFGWQYIQIVEHLKILKMSHYRKIPVLLASLLVHITTAGQPAFEADLVLTNGKVWTVDQDNPLAEAVAIWNGRILAVGSKKDIEKLIGSSTEVLDVKGNLVLPGFFDCHSHPESGGFHLLGVNLKDANSEEEFGRRLAETSKKLPPGAWITGGAWDHERWTSHKLPTAELIDKYVSDRPVLLTSSDTHMKVANSMALKIAGITAETQDPPKGKIVRKPGSSEPAGVLIESASNLVSRVIPPQSKAEIRSALEATLKEARRNGITCLQPVDLTPTSLLIYQQLLNEGKLTARIYGFFPMPYQDQLIDLGIARNFNNNHWIAVGGIAPGLDGSLGAGSALFFEPYTNDPSNSGQYLMEPKLFKQHLLEADKAHLQLAVHSIGDKSTSDLFDIFAEIAEENGPRDRRFRNEHAQHLHPKDLARFVEMGVIASMMPYEAIDDGRFAENRIGPERCKYTYAIKSLLDSNAVVAFGTDWPIAPLDGILGIYAAVTRRTLDDKNPDGWIPEQKITVEQAIEAFTLSAAYASFWEDITGSISPRKLADLIVLSEDIMTIDPHEIEHVKVLYTIVNGEVVYKYEGQ